MSKLVEVAVSMLPLILPSRAHSVKLNEMSMTSFTLQSRVTEVMRRSVAFSIGERGSRALDDILSDGDEDRWRRMCESELGMKQGWG